jgi:hypothetical protein
MSKRIGIIAEDKSDVEVVTEILAKYMNRNAFTVKQFVGNGCGKLKQKCDSWAEMLIKSGCEHVFLFHDLDRNDEKELRKKLENKLTKKKFPNTFIVIPIEELEAWLLSDSVAIQKVFSLKKIPKKISNCEQVSSPKEYLAAMVWSAERKKYVNTIHNRKISEHTSLENFMRCPSFKELHDYLTETICA